jgi:hypothetical protein
MWALLLGAVACGDPFDPASRVSHNRVLGAEAWVEGDPSRAWPQPGETINVRWLVVDEGAARPLSWAFAWCPAAPTAFGTPFCVQGVEPTFAPPQLAPGDGPPALTIDVPAEGGLAGANELLVLGVICAEGMLTFPEALPEDVEELSTLCEGDNARATPVILSVPLQLGDATNHRPGIATVRLDGALWPEPPEEALGAPAEGCPADASTVPRVSAPGGEEGALAVAIEVTEGSHEEYTMESASGELVTHTESLRIQHVVTAGEMPRLFSILDDPDDRTAEVDWHPPAEEDRHTPEHLVRVHVVVTDGRAGTTVTSRALCLVGE